MDFDAVSSLLLNMLFGRPQVAKKFAYVSLYPNFCHLCSSKLVKLCSTCKSIQYCSKQHQKEDWTDHKEICKILSHINKTVSYNVGCSFEEWKYYLAEKEITVKLKLKRRLTFYEKTVCRFPFACIVCYKQVNDFKTCSNCSVAVYCSLEHQLADEKRHKKHCHNLRVCQAIEINATPEFIQLECRAKFEELPKNSLELLRSFGQNFETPELESASDDLSHIGTFLFALEKMKFMKKRKYYCPTRRCFIPILIIHMIGASEMDLDVGHFRAVLTENIDSVQHIAVEKKSNDQICHTDPNVTDYLNEHNVKWEKYSDVVNDLPPPNVIMILDNNFNGQKNDYFKDPALFKALGKHQNVPIIISGHQKEFLTSFVNDMTTIGDFLPKLKIQENPFRSLRPRRTWDKKTLATYFHNAYVAGLIKQ